jgi:hypothetical protein
MSGRMVINRQRAGDLGNVGRRAWRPGALTAELAGLGGTGPAQLALFAASIPSLFEIGASHCT